jgi:hypothetical protein
VSKAIDKAAGAEREVVGVTTHPDGNPRAIVSRETGVHDGGQRLNGIGLPVTAPATDLARQWEGWGTALKPAYEPIVMARKPLIGSVAANVERYGTGGINVDGCRIAYQSDCDRAESEGKNQHTQYKNPHSNRDSYSGDYPPRTDYDGSKGRWPANVLLDEAAAALLDAQSGERKSPKPYVKHQAGFRTQYVGGAYQSPGLQSAEYGDTGGASRFFFIARDSDEANLIADSEAGILDEWQRPDQNPNEQTATTSHERATSGATSADGSGSLTSSNGNGTMALFPMDSNSITSTETSKTTESKTSNLSRQPTISASTRDANDAMASGSSPAPSAASSSPSTPITGISASRDGPSTVDADRAISARSLPINNSDGLRLHYTAKASRRERNAGLGGPDGVSANTHPT